MHVHVKHLISFVHLSLDVKKTMNVGAVCQSSVIIIRKIQPVLPHLFMKILKFGLKLPKVNN